MSANVTSNPKGPQETAVCMGFDAMRICLGMKPETFTLQQIEQWMWDINTPSHQEIADSLSHMANGTTKCPVCGRTYVHDHTPEELIIYRNGVKYGRSIAEDSVGGGNATTPSGAASASSRGKVGASDAGGPIP